MLRNAELRDVDFIVEGFGDIHSNFTLEEKVAFRHRILHDVFGSKKAAQVYIYEIDGKAVGFFLTSSCYFASTGSIMWVSQGYIAPKYRGKNFGVMFNLLQQKAKERGEQRIVWASEAKKARLNLFWKRKGFKELNEFKFWLSGL